MWTALINASVYSLSCLLFFDLPSLRTTFEEHDAKFLQKFIQSLPLEPDVVRAIGIHDQDDARKIRDKGFTVGDLLDNLKSESDVQEILELERPALGCVWNFTERFITVPKSSKMQ
jgi:hypothetical protein